MATPRALLCYVPVSIALGLIKSHLGLSVLQPGRIKCTTVQVEGLGWSIGDLCYSTISHTANGKSIVPGSRGIVTGPCTDPSAADADQRVEVKFDCGLVANILAKTQIKTAAAQVRTDQSQSHTQRPE